MPDVHGDGIHDDAPGIQAAWDKVRISEAEGAANRAWLEADAAVWGVAAMGFNVYNRHADLRNRWRTAE